MEQKTYQIIFALKDYADRTVVHNMIFEDKDHAYYNFYALIRTINLGTYIEPDFNCIELSETDLETCEIKKIASVIWNTSTNMWVSEKIDSIKIVEEYVTELYDRLRTEEYLSDMPDKYTMALNLEKFLYF